MYRLVLTLVNKQKPVKCSKISCQNYLNARFPLTIHRSFVMKIWSYWMVQQGGLGLFMTPGCCKILQLSLKQTTASPMTLTYQGMEVIPCMCKFSYSQILVGLCFLMMNRKIYPVKSKMHKWQMGLSDWQTSFSMCETTALSVLNYTENQ